MRTRLLFVALIGFVAIGMAQDLRVIEDPNNLFSGLSQITLPETSRGVVIADRHQFILIDRKGRHGNPEDNYVTVVDTQGKEVFQRPPAVDFSGNINLFGILSAALRTPDRLVVSLAVRSHDEQHGSFLFEYEIKTGDLVRRIRTNPIQCLMLHGSDDGTLWCMGYDLEKDTERRLDFDLVYRFDSNGILLGGSLPRDTFPETIDPSDDQLDPWDETDESWPRFFESNKMCLWLPAIRELITFEPSGVVGNRSVLPAFPDHATEASVTAVNNGDIVALVTLSTGDGQGQSTRIKELFMLSEGMGAWVPLGENSSEIPLTVSLIGGEADILYLWKRKDRQVISYPIIPKPDAQRKLPIDGS